MSPELSQIQGNKMVRNAYIQASNILTNTRKTPSLPNYFIYPRLCHQLNCQSSCGIKHPLRHAEQTINALIMIGMLQLRKKSKESYPSSLLIQTSTGCNCQVPIRRCNFINICKYEQDSYSGSNWKQECHCEHKQNCHFTNHIHKLITVEKW